MHEHAGRGLVDILAGADEGDAGLPEGKVDTDVVGAGSRQAVEFVDDAVVDVVFADVCEHPLQLGPFGGRGA
ncbi:hypothetical protein [Tsukamurella tyrosinosolvens]|uniref:hypothetical protein n=1 Tax=Tsukamurella tyrosinosolvens TaxID=57704 RepID=UPI0021F09180|nr:hypothetical protein [Tsukamurella tyrosinosolvens]